MSAASPAVAEAPTCWSCRFYSSGDGQNIEQGICRKNPPRANVIIQGGNATTLTVWPVVKNGIDWCGAWEAAEERTHAGVCLESTGGGIE